MASATAHVCPDIKEFGITELHVPPEEKIVADLIFVHGLQGHPRNTWVQKKEPQVSMGNQKEPETKLWSKLHRLRKAKPGLKSNSQEDPHFRRACYWPFDLIRKDFENIRVLTFGYDSHPSHFYKSQTNRMTISQHGRDLLNKVSSCRMRSNGRPIIFVAHSLGGILVKDAIIESRKYTHQPHMQDMSRACRAIFFFGTPHHGADMADWGAVLSNIIGSIPGGPSVFEKVLRGLAPDSEKLELVTRDFNDILNENVPVNEKIQICSVQEGSGMTRLNLVDQKVFNFLSVL